NACQASSRFIRVLLRLIENRSPKKWLIDPGWEEVNDIPPKVLGNHASNSSTEIGETSVKFVCKKDLLISSVVFSSESLTFFDLSDVLLLYPKRIRLLNRHVKYKIFG